MDRNRIEDQHDAHVESSRSTAADSLPDPQMLQVKRPISMRHSILARMAGRRRPHFIFMVSLCLLYDFFKLAGLR